MFQGQPYQQQPMYNQYVHSKHSTQPLPIDRTMKKGNANSIINTRGKKTWNLYKDQIKIMFFIN